MNKRIYYLDHLRVFLTVLVLLHHAALPYTDIEGVWYVTDNGQAQSITSGILTFFIAINLFLWASFSSFPDILRHYLMTEKLRANL